MSNWGQVRIIRYILNGEEIGDGYCDEKCDCCEQRFQCYTTKKNVLIANSLTAKQLHSIQPYFLALRECKIMSCPHCLGLFKITYDQLQNNTKFRCKVCGKYNWGSSEADQYGVLIGELSGI